MTNNRAMVKPPDPPAGWAVNGPMRVTGPHSEVRIKCATCGTEQTALGEDVSHVDFVPCPSCGSTEFGVIVTHAPLSVATLPGPRR